MSKVKRVLSKKLSEKKPNLHCASISMINSYQSFSNLKQATEKPDIYSDSPYGQKILKVRSTSILKDPSLSQSTGQVTSPINSKFAVNLKPKIILSSAFASKIKEANENRIKIKKKPNLAERKSIDNQAYLIELKIDEIYLKHKENGISNEILDKYRECLEEIIHKDKIFGFIIAKIKFAYEDWIRSRLETSADSSKLKSEILEFSKKLADEIEENKRLHKKVQKFFWILAKL